MVVFLALPEHGGEVFLTISAGIDHIQGIEYAVKPCACCPGIVSCQRENKGIAKHLGDNMPTKPHSYRAALNSDSGIAPVEGLAVFESRRRLGINLFHGGISWVLEGWKSTCLMLHFR